MSTETNQPYDIDINKNVYADLDYDTKGNWDFDIDIDKYVDKYININVNAQSYIDLKGNAAEVDFFVEDVSETGDLEWDVTAIADSVQGMSLSSFATYAPDHALDPAYATSGVTGMALGKDTFTELVITYEAYDHGFVASGEVFAAADNYG